MKWQCHSGQAPPHCDHTGVGAGDGGSLLQHFVGVPSGINVIGNTCNLLVYCLKAGCILSRVVIEKKISKPSAASV